MGVAFSPLSEQDQKKKMTSSEKTLTNTGMSDLDVASVYGHLYKFTAALVDLDKKDKEAGRKRMEAIEEEDIHAFYFLLVHILPVAIVLIIIFFCNRGRKSDQKV